MISLPSLRILPKTIIVFLSLIISVFTFENPTVNLDYGVFQGKYNAQYNISYFRKIPFAASTAGQNRFRAPQPPEPILGDPYDTNQSFDMCVQRTVNGSEDCLYLGLYSRPWTDPNAKRPVLVTFYGGAFIQGSASFTIPPPAYPVLNVSQANDFIVVYPNYRLNAFGFLPGKQVKESPTADLNPGLLDQQAALAWVHKYISQFGGDPQNVTIWGQSAGAGSVVAQVIANGGNTTPRLFNKAMASSPFWPKTYRYDSSEAEVIYNQLVSLAGCSKSRDTLACLKSIDVQTIRNASLIIDASHTYNASSYTWAPVIDDSFIREPLTEAVRGRRTNADLGFTTYNLHEGENFIPPGLAGSTSAGGFDSSTASFGDWLSGFLPDFSTPLLREVKTLYPDMGEAEEISYNATYQRAGLIYRDVVLACPAYWVARSARSDGWVGEYTISPAKHGSDTIYWNQVNAVQKSQPLIYEGYAGALASFVQTGNPNAHKVTDGSVPGVPEVSTNEEFVVEADCFQNFPIKMLELRCAFWEAHGTSIPM